ncbi:MAG: serine hydrolase domain-containing protein [Chloroflexota bacterium]
MKNFLRSALLALLFLLPLTGCGMLEEDDPPEQPAPAGVTANSNEANQQVDALFAGFVEDDSPGGAVIVLQNGAVVYQAAYGLANLETGEALTTGHIFHIASTGKQMTTTTILMLVAQGKLELDAPVGRYVPEVAQFGDAFTVRRLLTHTAGLDDYEEDLEEALFARAGQPTNADLVAVLSEMDAPPLPLGGQFEYSNVGYDLLAVVIERVSGMKFPEFMARNIFTPLGMKDTFSLPNPQRRAGARVAMSYTGENGVPEAYPEDDLDNLYGSGSIYTTLADFARYDEALYGNQLLPPEVLAQAFEPSDLEAEYGMGWELDEWQGLPYVGHSGAWLGFNSDYVRFPGQHFSVIVLLNRDYDYPDEPRIALQVAAFYLER